MEEGNQQARYVRVDGNVRASKIRLSKAAIKRL